MDLNLPEELVMVRDTVREFVQNELIPIEQEVLVREKGGMRGAPIPRDKRERLKKLAVEQGLWAMTAPESLGGGGLDTLGACLVAEELGKSFVDFDFGDIPPVLFQANAEQIQMFLRPLVAGEKVCAIAFREPGTVDLKVEAATEGEGWRLTGRKLVAEADLFLVFAGAPQVICYLVETDREGVSWRQDELILQQVHVPSANVLGQVGGALALCREHIDARRVRAAARRVGIASRLLEMSCQYARDWKALGRPLSVRPAIQRHLADMDVELDAARWLVYRAACEIDQGERAAQHALHAYVFAEDMLRRSVERTTLLYGGPAHAADFPVIQMYGAGGADQAERILELQRFQISNSLLSTEDA